MLQMIADIYSHSVIVFLFFIIIVAWHVSPFPLDLKQDIIQDKEQ